MASNLGIFFLYEILQIDKFEIQILQIQILQYYFQIPAPKHPNQENFAVTQIRGS